MMRRPRLLALLASGFLVVACGASDQRFGPVQRTASALTVLSGGPPAHVAVIVMENEEFGNIIGSRSTPYINTLARHYGLARSMFAASHPSLPNYLALTGGSTFGISSDCTDCSVRANSSLPTQLSGAHISWRAYMEGIPHACFGGPGAGDYAKKHDPFMYYTHVTRSPGLCSHVVALRQLGADESGHRLPRFVWITPNLCHDMHDCGTAVGDRFLASFVPRLLSSLGRNGLLFLTWDEGSSDQGCCRLAAGGHVAMIVAGPGARPHSQLKTPVDHYSTLQAIEDVLRLPRLRGAACRCTPSLSPLLLSRP